MLVAGLVSAFAVDDGDEPLDEGRAKRCGMEAADRAGMEPTVASASRAGTTWRISVVVDRGVLALTVRGDGRILEAVMSGRSGGVASLDRPTRLEMFERGC